MPTAAFTTLGCKVNQYETQKILESFEANGFGVVAFDQPADVYVINTCSVTSVAEVKSRYTVRKALRTNPDGKIVVTGCAGQMSLNKCEAFEGAHLVVPNASKLETFSYFAERCPELVRAAREAPVRAEPLQGRTRATLKVQDGCSVMCSYCSIPYTRPVMTSRPYQAVLEEARQMVELGYRELILTGVLIGAYGPETGSGGPDFETLVEMLSDAVGDRARLRISSIEVRQVSDRLIRLLEAGAVVPHLHIPLQSGDDQVLMDMNRPYRQADYLDLCTELYRRVPDITLTTDIMVGFPTETHPCFEATVKVCEHAKFAKIHAFRFSPRFGTPADRFGDPVSDPVKQARSVVLGELSSKGAVGQAARFVGRRLRVLVEGRNVGEGLLEGLSDNYLTVQLSGPRSLQRQFVWVEAQGVSGSTLWGEPIASNEDPSRFRLVAG